VIPAHNEEAAIGRLLSALIRDTDEPFEIIVVANGCTDATAAAAQDFGRSVRIVETEVPSKANALKLGSSVASAFPRVLIDADVEIDGDAVRRLVDRLDQGHTLACGPERILDTTRSSLLVRSFYRVWQALPQVEAGLFGRGVIALSQEGFARIERLPQVMSDDLAVSLAFDPGETAIVRDALVRIWPPRTVGDLIRRRVRIYTGTAQIDDTMGRTAADRTSPRVLYRLARRRPALTCDIAAFVVIAVCAKLSARRRVRRGDYQTWLRDESSRLAR
jgi:glycosyltransferase involved in cell wall biosynthesis